MDPGHKRRHWISSPGHPSQLQGTPPLPTAETGEWLYATVMIAMLLLSWTILEHIRY